MGSEMCIRDRREGARALQLGEDAGLLGAREQAGLRDRGEQLDLVQPREQLDRRPLQLELAALEGDALDVVEADDLLLAAHRDRAGGGHHQDERPEGQGEFELDRHAHGRLRPIINPVAETKNSRMKSSRPPRDRAI